MRNTYISTYHCSFQQKAQLSTASFPDVTSLLGSSAAMELDLGCGNPEQWASNAVVPGEQ
ncbi:hypothetical protein M9458_033072, partial [Cirrhinus mrigala]